MNENSYMFSDRRLLFPIIPCLNRFMVLSRLASSLCRRESQKGCSCKVADWLPSGTNQPTRSWISPVTTSLELFLRFGCSSKAYHIGCTSSWAKEKSRCGRMSPRGTVTWPKNSLPNKSRSQTKKERTSGGRCSDISLIRHHEIISIIGCTEYLIKIPWICGVIITNQRKRSKWDLVHAEPL